MNRLILFLLLLALPARAAHVQWTFQSANTNAQAVRTMYLYLTTPYTNGSSAIVTWDRLIFSTTTNGTITVSNLYDGSNFVYRSEFQGTSKPTTNWYTFPQTNGLIKAADWVAPMTNGAGIVAYSRAQADNRFYLNSNPSNFISNPALNPTILASNTMSLSLHFTNGLDNANTPAYYMNFLTGTNIVALNFGGDAANANSQIKVDTAHSGSPATPYNTELKLLTVGNTIALVPAYGSEGEGAIQVGAGYNVSAARYAGTILWMQNQQIFTDTLGHSGALLMRCKGEDGAGHTYPGLDIWPGFVSQMTDTNGLGSWEVDLPQTFAGVESGVPWDIRAVTTNGMRWMWEQNKFTSRVDGRIVTTKTTSNVSGSTLALNCSRNVLDHTITSSTLTVSTTGWPTNSGDSMRVAVMLHGGTTTTLTLPTGPTGWNTNGVALPTTLAQGTILLLDLLVAGVGETNVSVVSASQLTDNTFAWDSDFVAYSNAVAIAGVNITDPTLRSALNRFVTQQKAHSLWTKKDAIYPFPYQSGWSAATISNVSRINMKNPGTYNLTWSGSPTFSSTGVLGDGSTAYADTSFVGGGGAQFQQNSAHLMAYSESSSGTAGRCVIGCADTVYSTLNVNGLGTAWMCNNINGAANEILFPSGIQGYGLATRTSSTALAIYSATTTTSTSSTSAAVGSSTKFILARNAGGIDNYSNIKIAVASMGSGLSASEKTNDQADWDEYQAALGRKLP